MSNNYHITNTGVVVVGAIGYTVSFQDGQVIFENTDFSGHHWSFAFEKPREINDTPGIWYLVHMDERTPASHILGAYEYCCDTYGKSFEDKTPTSVR